MEELRFERFTVDAADDLDARAADWIRACEQGFYGQDPDEASIGRSLESKRARGSVLTGVYDDAQAPPSLTAVWPVATFEEFAGEITLAPGRSLPAHLISGVTVRATHRRRGILRRMMTESLDRAQQAGRPIAALTVSEGSIYGRFGFSPAAFAQTVRVAVRDGLGLRADVRRTLESSGLRVVAVHPRDMEAIHDAVVVSFHSATPGSIDRLYGDRQRVTGRWGGDEGGPVKDLRAYACLAGDGTPLGFATAKFSGWKDDPRRLEITDLMAADPKAELALWEHLGAHDLVGELTWGGARTDDALSWALANPRDLRTEKRTDSLWVRVLDVPAVLEARSYAGQGTFRIEVSDPQGRIEGAWRVDVADGAAAVRADEAPAPDTVSTDAETLASLVTGAIEPWQAAGLGRLRGDETVLELVRALWTNEVRPLSATFF
ncbi:GNAT family N-acetyltransferase [Zhihengliuella halotolerans]|uniref:Putative acetyltransferase n=1 Tax=Zhihengliuella halotolerans TaxID=370736 RepID=A0A4Q8AB24_9MICC|nr:GNAT family N-acetyltransferase [Zhihengliuella halotolerans]RZU61214.1 putative acetyltransferase [Zhihengliuella halotolerans]